MNPRNWTMSATACHAARGLLLASLAAGLLACEDREVSVTIRQMQPLDEANCAPATVADEALGQGVVDIALAQSYSVFPLVENRLLDITTVKGFGPEDARLDTHDVVLRAAVIEYSALGQITAEVPQQVRVPLAGSVKVGGQSVLSVEIFSNAFIQLLRSSPEFLLVNTEPPRATRASVKVIVSVTFEGETLDGTDVKTNTFLFPVDICNGCRVSYPRALLVEREGVGLVCPLQVDENGNPVASEVPDGLCDQFVGTDAQFVDCVTCQGAAVDSIARQLCQPAQTP